MERPDVLQIKMSALYVGYANVWDIHEILSGLARLAQSEARLNLRNVAQPFEAPAVWDCSVTVAGAARRFIGEASLRRRSSLVPADR